MDYAHFQAFFRYKYAWRLHCPNIVELVLLMPEPAVPVEVVRLYVVQLCPRLFHCRALGMTRPLTLLPPAKS